MKKKLLCFAMAVCLFASSLLSSGNVMTVEAAPQTVTVTPTKVANADNILPAATMYYAPSDANSYTYLFKFTLDESSVVRITGLSRYTFWSGSTNYKLTNSLSDSKATFKQNWTTRVHADCDWEKQVGNYCDKSYTLNKGTYYLYVNTNLPDNWKNKTYGGHKATDHDLGFWLAINRSTFTKTPTLKSCKNTKDRRVTVKYSKVSKAAGYHVQYSTNKKFKKARTVTSRKSSATLKNLKKKTYYVRVRAYRMENGQKYYGAWSKAKKVKIRK